MLSSLKRTIRSGWLSFSRNMGLSLATICIITMVIFLVTFLFIFNIASKSLISAVQEKIDISVYFKKDVLPEKIFEVKSELSKIPDVKSVEYVSSEKALEKFVEKHKDDPVLMDSLKEVGDNPFLASLNIKSWQASQYEQVSKLLENSSSKDLIEKVDYYQRKPIIDKIFSLATGINRGGIVFGIVLAVIAMLVALNTIRIAICNLSEEIATMRLVGASNWFIRGPFLVLGIIAGFLAGLIALLVTFAVAKGIDPRIKSIAPDISTFILFQKYFWNLVLIQFATGIGLGIISSAIAIRKYLRI